MSIDARVDYVEFTDDRSGCLHLIDRPPGRDGIPGTRGQATLHYDDAPHEVTALNGLDIWGSGDQIILGRESVIARRVSNTKIVFVGRQLFLDAVKKYHERLPCQ